MNLSDAIRYASTHADGESRFGIYSQTPLDPNSEAKIDLINPHLNHHLHLVGSCDSLSASLTDVLADNADDPDFTDDKESVDKFTTAAIEVIIDSKETGRSYL